MKNRVVITGIGAITPIGIGVKDFWEACLGGKSGVGDISLFDASNYETKIAAEVKDFNPGDFMLPQVFRKTDRFAQMGVAGAKLAIEDAGLKDLIDKTGNKIPVIIGSGLGGSLFHEEQIFKLVENKDPRRVLSSSVPRITPNAVSAYIALEHSLRGPNLTISTACSSGSNAIATAANYIEDGVANIVVTGGVECPITPFTYAAYQSLRVLSKGNGDANKWPRPFDEQRDGFVLGEGAGILVLEEYEAAKARGAKIYGELKGYSSNCGVYHMAAPEPNGDDAAQAMMEAMAKAAINYDEVNYINAHGTATKMNDISESKAINKVFKNAATPPFVSSTKSMTGHTIGAAGAIEAIITALAVYTDEIPPTINCDNLDNECSINIVKNKAVKSPVKNAMSNSFGFGSNNSVLIIGKV